MKPLDRRKQYSDYRNVNVNQDNSNVARSTGPKDQTNPFEQTIDDMQHKLDPDQNLAFYDQYEFPNGSLYKG
jgi:hypothetical protein